MQNQEFRVNKPVVTTLYGLFWVKYSPEGITFRIDIQTPVWEARMEEGYELKVVELSLEEKGYTFEAANSLTSAAFAYQRIFPKSLVESMTMKECLVKDKALQDWNNVALFVTPEEAIEWQRAKVAARADEIEDEHIRKTAALRYHRSLLEGIVYDEKTDLLSDADLYKEEAL